MLINFATVLFAALVAGGLLCVIPISGEPDYWVKQRKSRGPRRG